MDAGRRLTGIAALLAALLAAGCSSGSDAAGTSGSGTKDEPVEVREPDAPEPSEDLTEALGGTATTLSEAGCSFGTYELGSPDHVKPGTDLDSPSFPPTSGPHYGDWAPFGLYAEPVADGHAIHNLEHGGVTAWLGTEVDDATSEAVADLLDDGEKWLVAPREDITGLFSAAWGAGLHCPPAALEQLGAQVVAESLDAWYEVVESTGSEAEKDIPAYAGAMREPVPERDISVESPF